MGCLGFTDYHMSQTSGFTFKENSISVTARTYSVFPAEAQEESPSSCHSRMPASQRGGVRAALRVSLPNCRHFPGLPSQSAPTSNNRKALSQFWTLHVLKQGVGGAMLSVTAVGKNP